MFCFVLVRNEISSLIKRRNRSGTTVEEKIEKIRSEKVLKEEFDDEDDDDGDDVDDDEDEQVGLRRMEIEMFIKSFNS